MNKIHMMMLKEELKIQEKNKYYQIFMVKNYFHYGKKDSNRRRNVKGNDDAS